MAEKKGFFRKIFTFGSDSEEKRTPENSAMPKASDTEVGHPESPDPDVRPVAAAHTGADEEAGADVEDGGGITPLAERQSGEKGSFPTEGEETEKKTP